MPSVLLDAEPVRAEQHRHAKQQQAGKAAQPAPVHGGLMRAPDAALVRRQGAGEQRNGYWGQVTSIGRGKGYLQRTSLSCAATICH